MMRVASAVKLTALTACVIVLCVESHWRYHGVRGDNGPEVAAVNASWEVFAVDVKQAAFLPSNASPMRAVDIDKDSHIPSAVQTRVVGVLVDWRALQCPLRRGCHAEQCRKHRMLIPSSLA